jgi:hypothetical protein
MASLADLPEIIGFFSYSRDDDEDSHNALSTIRELIQNELRARLGRSRQSLRLWQDQEAIAPGSMWESEINTAVKQSVFFIPIITPRVINSKNCGVEFKKFLDREKEHKRTSRKSELERPPRGGLFHLAIRSNKKAPAFRPGL